MARWKRVKLQEGGEDPIERVHCCCYLRKAKDFLEETAAKLKPSDCQIRVATTLGTPVEEILQED